VKNDDFGDRMKLLESAEAGRRLMPLLPALARLDGKGFSRFTHGMERPFDKRMSDLMVETTKYLVQETNAVCGYCQSDEITLAWYSDDYNSQIYFDGKIQKMVSTLAAKCSVIFNRMLPDFLPQEYAERLPTFDCRVWNVPTLSEATNCFLWRENDATKNSISMAARHYFSHKSLDSKNGSEMQEMLWKEHGVNWNNYPDFFKRGTYVQRKKSVRKFTIEELELLPKLHEARKNPELLIERSDVMVVAMPKLSSVANRVNVIFFGEDPKVESKIIEEI
jgi:tRNA(His) 5'-end guanylyltransferase